MNESDPIAEAVRKAEEDKRPKTECIKVLGGTVDKDGKRVGGTACGKKIPEHWQKRGIAYCEVCIPWPQAD